MLRSENYGINSHLDRYSYGYYDNYKINNLNIYFYQSIASDSEGLTENYLMFT